MREPDANLQSGERTWLTVIEAMVVLGVTERQIRYAIAKGRLRVHRLVADGVRSDVQVDIDEVERALAVAGTPRDAVTLLTLIRAGRVPRRLLRPDTRWNKPPPPSEVLAALGVAQFRT